MMKIDSQSIFKKFVHIAKIALITLGLTLGVVYVQATWMGPSTTPTGGNIDSAVTTDVKFQIKNGDLGVTNLTASNAAAFDGYAKIGDTNLSCGPSFLGALRYHDVSGAQCLQYCGYIWVTVACSGIGYATGDIDSPAVSTTGNDGPVSVASGGSVTLAWDSSNTDFCKVYDGATYSNVAYGTSGNYNASNLSSGRTYYLICSHSNGSPTTTLDTIDVNVTAPTTCDLPSGWSSSTIADGQSVTAYQSDTSADCSANSETRTCNAPTLSGSYQYETCTNTGGSYDYDLTIPSDTNDYDIAAQALAQGWDGSSVINVRVTVNAGVMVSDLIWNSNATSPSHFGAMTTGALPSGSTVTIVNNGTIVGRGGDGGETVGACSYDLSTESGEAGGDAITLTVPTTIDNTNGHIYGGGGGGGAGGWTSNGNIDDNTYSKGDDNLLCSTGGCGGGGAGSAVGNIYGEGGTVCKPGPGNTGYGVCSDGGLGEHGTVTTGGAAGAGGADTGDGRGPGGDGGAGGDLGQPGENGVTTGSNRLYTCPGGPGGAAGNAVLTNGNTLTWTSQGDTLGPIN